MTALQRGVLALAVLVVVVAAVVVLTVTGNDAAPLLGWLIPIVTGVWGVNEVRANTRDQNTVLTEIAENVNGKLDARIRAAVRAVVNEPIAGPLGEPGPPYDPRGG